MDTSTINIENIPKAMQELPAWTVWQLKAEPGGKQTKIPFNATDTNQHGSSTNPCTWSSLNQALTVLANPPSFTPLNGLQFALQPGWVGIDLDDCLNTDRSLKPWARDIVDTINSYTEVSPSGTGLKIFLKAGREIFTHRAKQPDGGEIEVETGGKKLFTVTTLHLPGTPIEVAERSMEFSSIYDKYLYRDGEGAPPVAPEEMSVTFEDRQIVDRIVASRCGPRFTKIFSGQAGSDSDIDFELAGMICFYTTDVEQVIRIMLESSIVREKWIKKDYYYLRLTINKQIGGEKWSGGDSTDGQWMSMGRVATPAPATPVLPVAIPSISPAVSTIPPGVFIPPMPGDLLNPATPTRPEGEAGEMDRINKMLDNPIDIQTYYDNAPGLVKRLTVLLCSLNDKMPAALNFFSAMALINGAAGKKLCTINKGTMLYAPYWNVASAPTGLGKSTMLRVKDAIQEVLTERGHVNPFKFMADKFTMSSLFSGYGAIVPMKKWETLNDVEQSDMENRLKQYGEAKQGRMMISDEFGHNLGIILRSGVEGGEKGNLLKLADSGTTITGDTVTKGIRTIYDVCTGFIAFTQPEVWQENFSPEEHLDSGLAGRFVMVGFEDYTLTIHTVEEPFKKTLEGVKDVFRELLARLDQIADRVQNDPPNVDDERGRIFDEVASEADVAVVVKHGFIDLTKLKGKLIGLALKLTQMHVFLGDTINLPQLVGVPRVTAHAAVLPQAPVRHSHSMGDDVVEEEEEEEEEEAPSLTYADTTLLYDQRVYRHYVRLMMTAAVKAYNTRPTKSAREKLQDKAVRIIKRHGKGGSMLASTIRNRSTKWQLGGYDLKARDFISEVIQPAVENSLLRLVSDAGDPVRVELGREVL